MTCTASPRLIEEAREFGLIGGDEGSEYAAEGTLAHELCEIKAGLAFGLISPVIASIRETEVKIKADRNGWDFEEMTECANAYVALLDSITPDGARVFLEQRLSSGVPGVFGTADAAVVDARNKVLRIVDYKHGRGVLVEVTDNPQLMLYGLGGLELFDLFGPFDEVCLTVHQPRGQGHESINTWCISTEELIRWRDEIAIPAALQADGPNGVIRPSREGCRWCPIAGICKERQAYATREAFGNPAFLEPEELGAALHRIPDIEAWCKAVREVSLRMAHDDEIEIPGWKVVRSGGIRKITDPDEAWSRLAEAGYSKTNVFEEKLTGITKLEKLLGGRKVFDGLLGDLVTKSQGRESLAPTDDPREGITSALDAAEVFKENH